MALLRHYRWLLLLGAIFLALAHCIALLFRIKPAVSLWFPPSGVAIVLAMWLGPTAALLSALVSVLFAPLWGSSGWSQGVGLLDGVEPLLVWWIYRYIWRGSPTLGSLRDVIVFILSAPVFACLGSAITGSLAQVLVGNLSLSVLPSALLQWWLGNAIGMMTIAPPALLVLTPWLQRQGWILGPPVSVAPAILQVHHPVRRRAEKLAIWGCCIVVALLSVSHTGYTGFVFQQFAFLNFIPILWAALRFGTVGGATTASFCVLATAVSYVLKYPQAMALPNFPLSPDVLAVHKLSLLTQCMIGLLIGTAITQQTQTQVQLATSEIRLAEYAERARLDAMLAETNQTLAATNAQLEQANRLKDDFLAVLSHELRSPLNPILGWSKLLQSGRLDPANIRQGLETIERNARLQATLIEDLLDVSRILRGKLVLQKVDLDLLPLVRFAVEAERLAAEGKQISLVFTPAVANPLSVHGDPNRLQQVLGNLLSNAIKFTPAGGRVEVGLKQEANLAIITVTDTGKGIDPKFLPHIFERFRQQDSSTTRKFGGLGLGLAIVNQIVELHQGQIRALSEGEGQGATFIVKLPRQPTVSISQSPVGNSLPPTDNHVLRGLTALIVDDDPDARELLRQILQLEQVEVILVDSAPAALEHLANTRPDLLISDISMPGMDGYELIRQIRQHYPAEDSPIPALALTANAREEDRTRVIAAGFDGHLAKPITPNALLAEVQKLLRCV